MALKTQKKQELRIIEPWKDFDWNRANGAFWVEIQENVEFIRVTIPCRLPVDGCEWYDPTKTEYKELNVGDVLVRETRAHDEVVYFAVSKEKFREDFVLHPRQNPLKFDWSKAETAVHTATGATVKVLRIGKDFHSRGNASGLHHQHGRRTHHVRKGDVLLRGANGMIFDLPEKTYGYAYDRLPSDDPRCQVPPTMEPFLA
ncbi:MAG: hypothetical protein L6Q57_04430 [Alphaproteobacteria bacterium]|nr:hypothetical protein [Alphaproteobacteria bacterium]